MKMMALAFGGVCVWALFICIPACLYGGRQHAKAFMRFVEVETCGCVWLLAFHTTPHNIV